MSINEMVLLSNICFVGMILFLLLAVLLFFKLNIRKAWEIVSGKYLSGHSRQNGNVPSAKLSTREMMNSVRLQDRDKTDLLSSTELRNLLQEGHETKILQTGHETKILQTDYETTILQQDNLTTLQAHEEATVLRNGETVLLAGEAVDENELDIIVDITYVHTQIIL